jgi:hypothetical protein
VDSVLAELKQERMSRKKFSDMGLCEACADNISVYYTEQPESRCGKLARQALEGNSEAIGTLQSFPDYCHAAYDDSQAMPRQTPRSTSTVSVDDFLIDKEDYSEGQPVSVHGHPLCINGDNCSLYTDGSGMNSLPFTYRLPRDDRKTLLACGIALNACQATIHGTITHDDTGDLSIEVTSITWSAP